METAPQQLLAQSILAKEKRKAHAHAALNRPASMVPATLATCTLAALGTYLLNAEKVPSRCGWASWLSQG